MSHDRITQLRISGLRTIEDLTLKLDGLTVLIGDNGTGKSSILEALEILRKAAQPGKFTDNVLGTEHGPIQELIRLGRDRLALGLTVEGGGPKLVYSFTVKLAGISCVVHEELLEVHERLETGEDSLKALKRTPESLRWFDQAQRKLVKVDDVSPQELAAASAAQGLVKQEAFVRLIRALQGIEYHPPFDVRPLWQQRELQTRVGPRWPSRPDAAERVRRYGQDLPAALTVLRNDRDAWERLIARARAAIGIDLVDILLLPAGAGQLDIQLKFASRATLPLRALSEGQLSFLTMLAVVELGTGRTLLALDEPDIHYHPELSVNLVQILEDVAREHPVIVATHSDRLLDALENPAASARLCELDAKGSTLLRQPNSDLLKIWLKRYRGLGAIRADGYEPHVFDGGPLAGTEKAS